MTCMERTAWHAMHARVDTADTIITVKGPPQSLSGCWQLSTTYTPIHPAIVNSAAAPAIIDAPKLKSDTRYTPVSYTHLTLPTILLV